MSARFRILASRLRAISLIETMVAVFIISLLCALLFPAVTQMRSRAAALACSSNLRQLHLYLNDYAKENNGAYPAVSDAATTNSWWLTLQNYINDPSQVVASRKKTIFLCPQAVNTYPGGVARRTYAMNIEGIPDWRIPIRPLQSTKPAQTLFLIDSACAIPNANAGDGWQYFRATSSVAFASAVEARHLGRFNALFLDGHVESLSPADPILPQLIRNLNN